MPARSSIVLAFVAGLFLTLAVAWACALWSPIDDPLPEYAVDVAAIIVADSTPFDVDVVRPSFGYSEFGRTTIESVDLETGQSWQMQSPIPVLVESSAGWPCLCLTRSEVSGTNWFDQGIVIKEGTLGVIDGRRIPLRPIWTGLAINTVLFGTIMVVLAWAPGRVRSKWRRSKGRCGNCGYPQFASLACPECGQSTT